MQVFVRRVVPPSGWCGRAPFAGAVLAAALTVATPAAGEPGRCLATADTEARYERILTVFERGEPAAKFWWISWTTAYSAATLGQGILGVATHDRGTRIDSVVGAAESAVGIVGMLVAAPRTPMWAADELLAMDDQTPCARVRRLRRAEELLRKSADEERQGRSWTSQLLGDVINLAAPAVLWIGYHRYASGWYTLAPGVAIQEAQMLTQPTAALGAWHSYAASMHSPKPASWSVAPLLGGAAVVGTF